MTDTYRSLLFLKSNLVLVGHSGEFLLVSGSGIVPGLSQQLADISEGSIGVGFLDLSTVLFGEVDVSTRGAVGSFLLSLSLLGSFLGSCFLGRFGLGGSCGGLLGDSLLLEDSWGTDAQALHLLGSAGGLALSFSNIFLLFLGYHIYRCQCLFEGRGTDIKSRENTGKTSGILF
jgi:hypothetical protein